jgi:hypothetical protein
MRERTLVVGSVAVVLALMLAAEAASASEGEQAPLGPLPRTLELTLGLSGAQGFGRVAPDTALRDVAGLGAKLSIGLDVRVSHHLSLGAEAQYVEFATAENRGARGIAVDPGLTFHGTPGLWHDPWLRLGVGYHLLWDIEHNGATAPTNVFHGFDLLTLKVGYDIRATNDVALAPVAGVDIQAYTWENATPTHSFQVATLVFVGIQGRFTLGHQTAGAMTVAGADHLLRGISR